MASARTAESGSGAKPETTRASRTHEYLIRRHFQADTDTPAVWIECGSITAANPKAALTAYGEQHAGEIAELATDGDVILEAVSPRFRGVKRANPTRQLVINWRDA